MFKDKIFDIDSCLNRFFRFLISNQHIKNYYGLFHNFFFSYWLLKSTDPGREIFTDIMVIFFIIYKPITI